MSLPGDSFYNTRVIVRDCSQVEITRFRGGSLELVRSRVAIHGSLFLGERNDSCGPGGAGIRATSSSELFVGSSTISGAPDPDFPWCNGLPGDGLHVSDTSQVTALNTSLDGGTSPFYPDGDRFVVDGTSSLVELSTAGVGSSPGVSLPSTAREGQLLVMSVSANAGTNLVLFYSIRPGPLRTYSGVLGPLALQPPLKVAYRGTPGTSLSITAPQLPPAMLSATLYVQPVLTSGSERLLADPFAVTVIDSSL